MEENKDIIHPDFSEIEFTVRTVKEKDGELVEVEETIQIPDVEDI